MYIDTTAQGGGEKVLPPAKAHEALLQQALREMAIALADEYGEGSGEAFAKLQASLRLRPVGEDRLKKEENASAGYYSATNELFLLEKQFSLTVIIFQNNDKEWLEPEIICEPR